MRHILFPSDGSHASNHAFGQLLPLARVLKARVTLLHDYALLNVTRPEALEAIGLADHGLGEIEDRLKSAGLRQLESLGQELEQAGIASEILQARGHAGKLIVETALRLGVDLIVMGHRGLNAIDAFTLGSASSYVLHNSACPVMLIPLPEAEPDHETA